MSTDQYLVIIPANETRTPATKKTFKRLFTLLESYPTLYIKKVIQKLVTEKYTSLLRPKIRPCPNKALIKEIAT